MPSGTRVLFELQTNGTLLSGAWLDLFERYEAAVGVSLDGPPHANDRHRLTHAGRSSAASAVRGIELLRSRPHLFSGLLAVVDLANDPLIERFYGTSDTGIQPLQERRTQVEEALHDVL